MKKNKKSQHLKSEPHLVDLTTTIDAPPKALTNKNKKAGS